MALEIKEGLSYMDASGNEIGPMEFDPKTGTSYVWDCTKTWKCYTKDGKYMEDGSMPELDLVSELTPATESPIRTVTRREPVSGKYSNGDVDVSVHPDGQIQISVSMLTLKGDRVRSACMVLSQLAEFLDEDKGEE